MEFEPIEIVEVIADEVGFPRGDGSRGSALYAVPIRLSRSLTADEGRVLVELWDRPPSFSTMHRPGIARVVGDWIILDGTTVDEIERYHAKTLRLIVDRLNEVVPEALASHMKAEEEEAKRLSDHRAQVESVASRLQFGS